MSKRRPTTPPKNKAARAAAIAAVLAGAPRVTTKRIIQAKTILGIVLQDDDSIATLNIPSSPGTLH